MGSDMVRRQFLQLTGCGLALAGQSLAPKTVPNSAGTEAPKLKAPAKACDCHIHIYDPARFPLAPSPRVAPSDAAVSQVPAASEKDRNQRVVIVTPRNYATDNRATIDAIAQLGKRNARGVAVLHPT